MSRCAFRIAPVKAAMRVHMIPHAFADAVHCGPTASLLAAWEEP